MLINLIKANSAQSTVQFKILYYSIRQQIMSFSNILQVKYHQQLYNQSDSQNNPIHRINRGLKKGKFYCNKQNDPYVDNRPLPKQKQKQRQLSFRSLSKAKEDSLNCNSNQKKTQKTVYSQCFYRKNSSEKDLFKDKSIQRKLNFNQNRTEASKQKEKKLNFTQIIKNSKQKRPVEKSLAKRQQKVIKPPLKQNNTFSKLKDKLINQRSYLDSKPTKQVHQKAIINNQLDYLDRVRVSVQIQQHLQAIDKLQLDMDPSL